MSERSIGYICEQNRGGFECESNLECIFEPNLFCDNDFISVPNYSFNIKHCQDIIDDLIQVNGLIPTECQEKVSYSDISLNVELSDDDTNCNIHCGNARSKCIVGIEYGGNIPVISYQCNEMFNNREVTCYCKQILRPNPQYYNTQSSLWSSLTVNAPDNYEIDFQINADKGQSCNVACSVGAPLDTVFDVECVYAYGYFAGSLTSNPEISCNDDSDVTKECSCIYSKFNDNIENGNCYGDVTGYEYAMYKCGRTVTVKDGLTLEYNNEYPRRKEILGHKNVNGFFTGYGVFGFKNIKLIEVKQFPQTTFKHVKIMRISMEIYIKNPNNPVNTGDYIKLYINKFHKNSGNSSIGYKEINNCNFNHGFCHAILYSINYYGDQGLTKNYVSSEIQYFTNNIEFGVGKFEIKFGFTNEECYALRGFSDITDSPGNWIVFGRIDDSDYIYWGCTDNENIECNSNIDCKVGYGCANNKCIACSTHLIQKDCEQYVNVHGTIHFNYVINVAMIMIV